MTSATSSRRSPTTDAVFLIAAPPACATAIDARRAIEPLRPGVFDSRRPAADARRIDRRRAPSVPPSATCDGRRSRPPPRGVLAADPDSEPPFDTVTASGGAPAGAVTPPSSFCFSRRAIASASSAASFAASARSVSSCVAFTFASAAASASASAFAFASASAFACASSCGICDSRRARGVFFAACSSFVGVRGGAAKLGTTAACVWICAPWICVTTWSGIRKPGCTSRSSGCSSSCTSWSLSACWATTTTASSASSAALRRFSIMAASLASILLVFVNCVSVESDERAQYLRAAER